MDGLIAVFGGTFDPPHIGHLILADEARSSLGAERVLWVVTGTPPHKPSVAQTPVETRLRMVEAAIAGNSDFEISRADIDRPPPHYALGTMAWLRERMPGARFVYLIGSDSLRDLPTWHAPAEFLAQCESLGVMRRPGADPDLALLEARIPGLRGKLRFFEAPLVGVSGHDIRDRVVRGAPYRYLVPSAVANIIRDERLYR
jgi:nicotinate-nucleotide adenylyltransferase